MNIAAGLAAGFGVLALGHRSTVFPRIEQRYWRFATGRILIGAAQIAACFALALGERSGGPAVLLLAITAWAGSLLWYGRAWERTNG